MSELKSRLTSIRRALYRMAQSAAHEVAKRVPGFPELVHGPLTYNQHGLATVHNCDFLHDPRFQGAYRLGEQTGSWGGQPIHWRAYVVCWAAEKASHLDGDFVECGVNKGGLSRTAMDFIGFARLDKTFYLVDTFRGFDDRYLSDGERERGAHGYRYEECYEQVYKTFERFRAVIVRGAVPETLFQVKAEKVCYLSLDMNCAAPEIAAAEYFWPKLVPGGVIVLDDYGWRWHEEQKLAFDRFAREKDVMVLGLPTGQGLIFKA
jgi:O-methyltransferase